MHKILVIGSINTDMIVKVQHLPVTGETVLGGKFYKLPGGKGANQAVTAQRAGGNVTFIASVGDDSFGHEAIKGYQQDNIDTSHISIVPHTATGVALITVDDQGKNTIAVASGANALLTPAIIEKKQGLIEQCDVVLLQLELPLDSVITAIDLAHQAERFIILNPAPAQPLPKELYSKINILTPNETEAEILSGIKVVDIDSAKQAAQRLLSYGLQRVIITLGAQGVVYSDNNSFHHAPGFKVNAVDSTAAGDVFNGALAAALTQGQAFLDALRFAQAAAALSVTQIGAQNSVPYKEDIEDFLASL